MRASIELEDTKRFWGSGHQYQDTRMAFLWPLKELKTAE
jgi:hypothetical protein